MFTDHLNITINIHFNAGENKEQALPMETTKKQVLTKEENYIIMIQTTQGKYVLNYELISIRTTKKI